MRVQSEKKYKSLEPIQPAVDFPDLVILSGLNGGGKTQLLTGIAEHKVSLTIENQPRQPIKLVDHNTLAPNDGGIVSTENVNEFTQTLITALDVHRHLLHSPGVSLIKGVNEQSLKVLLKIAKKANKSPELLSHDDVRRLSPVHYDSDKMDIFHQNFSSLFKRYQVKKEENEFKTFLHQKDATIDYLTDQEFLELEGHPPWLLVNEIIGEAGLDYRTNSPAELPRGVPFEFRLINKWNQAEVRMSELSGGEKVIMSLALSLYNSKFDIEFPRVLLMDEPDSHLHPSLTKQFLEVIQNFFVNQKQIKVIMTTHSPSTVALAPEESLYLMNKSVPRITKTTKDNALRLLTSGVPTLSINYENRRQVFVESQYDVTFYERVYEKLRDKLIPEISINFISSGVGGKGNCDQVKDVVNALSGYGNRTIYGIIDWDTKNTGNEFVKVLGKDKRYSIENYLFDPILLAAFLLREKFVKRSELKLAEGDRYTDFSKFDNVKLQAIADFIVQQIQTKVSVPADVNLQQVEYVGGQQIEMPTWFLRIQGHELESWIKEFFPPLRRYQREGELKREIISKVIDDIPEFIPNDVPVVLKEIQDYQE